MSEYPDTDLPPTAPVQRIRVAVLAVDDDGLAATLAAIGSQVYETEGVTIVDPDGDISEPGSLPVVKDFASFVTDLGAEIDHVWIVHGDARPRPDALGALVAEMERSDASVVGSKVVDAVTLDRLESVGSATDVFGEPYSGLDTDEVDLEQYDVVRDVAFVSAVSMLVRRDIVRGLRGIDPLLPPVAAGMDFSQRARVAGGRVMVAPSSEVLHERTCREDVEGWREWAGRMRSMLKAYRLITLAWVVPVGTLLGLFDGVARLFLGTTRPLSDFVRALGWNVAHLPGSLSARNAVRAVRHVGDEELFRYQVTGSVRLRTLATDVAERFGWVIDDEPGVVSEDDLEDEATAAGPVVAALGVLAVGLATRSFWAGTLPQSGFTLPIGDARAALAGFAGGWNPAGLGSSEPVHPSAAFFASFDWLTGGWAGTPRLLVAGLLIAVFFGTGRLLRELGITGPTRHLASVVAAIGTGTAAFAADADMASWLAVGPTLGAIAFAVSPWPASAFARVGRAGALIVASAVAGILAPGAALVIAVTSLVLWGAVPGVRWGVAVRGVLAADVSLLVAAPYLAGVSVDELTESGPVYDLSPSLLSFMLIVVAVVFGTMFASGRRHRVAFAGGALVAASVWLPSLELPRGDLGAAFALLAVVGLVLVVGAVIGLDTDGSRATVLGRGIGAAAAVGLVVLSLGQVVNGRAGFPQDQWADRLVFTESLGAETGAARVLVVGNPDQLPGEHRSAGAVSYRLLDVDGPTLEDARLALPRLGDDALADIVTSISGGELVRPGSVLAEFGIGWVAVVDDPAFVAAMAAQVDMDETPVSEDLTVFLNSVPSARAVADDGARWTFSGGSFTGRASDGTVRLADNASSRWGPGWEQDAWANRVSASDGVASYDANSLRRALGWVSLVVAALGVVMVPFARRAGR
ncbi:MAG: glycosyltransferase [Acidimicrobiia bacterium]